MFDFIFRQIGDPELILNRESKSGSTKCIREQDRSVRMDMAAFALGDFDDPGGYGQNGNSDSRSVHVTGFTVWAIPVA